MPVTSQIFLYSGTSAQPKPNISTETMSSLRNVVRLPMRSRR